MSEPTETTGCGRCEKAIPLVISLAAAFAQTPQNATELIVLIVAQIAVGAALLWVLYGPQRKEF